MKKPDEPARDCPLCPRLKAFRVDNRKAHPGWFNAPVPSFGPLDRAASDRRAGAGPSRAPTAPAGPSPAIGQAICFMPRFSSSAWRKAIYEERADDTLELIDCRIANSVRCVPPQNKPEPAEIKTCRRFLNSELETLPNVKAILALGKIAHDSCCKTLGAKQRLTPSSMAACMTIMRIQR